MEQTEKEKILIGYIRDLLSVISVMAIFIDGVGQAGRWYSDTVGKMSFNMREKQEEVLSYLAEECDQAFTVIEKEEDDKS